MTRKPVTVGARVLVQLYDGRIFPGIVKAIHDTVSGRAGVTSTKRSPNQIALEVCKMASPILPQTTVAIYALRVEGKSMREIA